MDIANRIKKLLDSVIGIPNEDNADILEFIENNEWGVAFEVLCSAIEQEELLISNEQFNEISSIGNEMDIDDALWAKIKPLRN